MAGQNPNALQAPAEGFGQNVTFAFNPDSRGMSQSAAIGADLVRAQTQGSPIGGGIQQGGPLPVAQADPSLGLLMKMANRVLDAQIQKKRQEAYVNGMQMAAQGASVADIVRDQPWWASITGDSDVVEGARAYTQHANVAKTVADWSGDMQNLRKLNGTEAADYMNKSISKAMTGDAATDAQIMSAFSRYAPTFLKNQAKENYQYMQEQAYSARQDMVNNEGVLFKQAMENDKSTPEDKGAAIGRFAESMVPADRDNLPQWRKSIIGNAEKFAADGNVHALNQMIDVANNTEMGSLMGGDVYSHMKRVAQQAERMAVSNYKLSDKFYGDMSVIIDGQRNGDFRSANELGTFVRSYNDTVKQQLGIKDANIFDPDDTLRMQTSFRDWIQVQLNHQQVEAQKQAVADSKAVQGVLNDNIIKSQFLLGFAPNAALGTKITQEDINATVSNMLMPAFDGSGRPAGGEGSKAVAALQRQHANFFPGGLKGVLSSNFSAGLQSGNPDMVGKAYNDALTLTAGMQDSEKFSMLKTVYGNDAKKMESLLRTMGGQGYGPQTGQQWMFAQTKMAFDDKPVRESPKDEREAVQKIVTDKTQRTLWKGIFGDQPTVSMNAGSMEQLSRAVASSYRDSQAATSDGAATDAYNTVLRNGGQVVGGYYIQGQRQDAKLTDQLSQALVKKGGKAIGEDTAQELANGSIRQLLGSFKDEPYSSFMQDGAIIFVPNPGADPKAKPRVMSIDEIAGTMLTAQRQAVPTTSELITQQRGSKL